MNEQNNCVQNLRIKSQGLMRYKKDYVSYRNECDDLKQKIFSKENNGEDNGLKQLKMCLNETEMMLPTIITFIQDYHRQLVGLISEVSDYFFGGKAQFDENEYKKQCDADYTYAYISDFLQEINMQAVG